MLLQLNISEKTWETYHNGLPNGSKKEEVHSSETTTKIDIDIITRNKRYITDRLKFSKCIINTNNYRKKEESTAQRQPLGREYIPNTCMLLPPSTSEKERNTSDNSPPNKIKKEEIHSSKTTTKTDNDTKK